LDWAEHRRAQACFLRERTRPAAVFPGRGRLLVLAWAVSVAGSENIYVYTCTCKYKWAN